MNVYGVGPPRSGTHMLAQCLSFIKETHHQCGDPESVARANIEASRGKSVDLSVYSDHGSEVGYTWTFVADRLDGKIIHLWRPARDWIQSAYRLGIGSGTGELFPWVHEALLDAPEDTIANRLAWMYRQYHEFLLEKVTNSYVVTPDRIVWEDLFDWLRWEYTSEQIRAIQAHQRTRPYARIGHVKGEPEGLDEAAFSCGDLEEYLESRTKFTREEAIHKP